MFLDNKAEQLNSQETTLHHIALNVSLEDFESERMRLEGLGLKVTATEHEWLHVRSLYFPDPERCPELVEGGNLLEFVCYDASVGQGTAGMHSKSALTKALPVLPQAPVMSVICLKGKEH
jgi:hypothetical protein